MANENIEGTATDSSGNPLQDAVIALFLTNKNASDGDVNDVQYTRTDSNGNYVIKDHPDADGTSQEWHVAGFYQDGTGEFNALSKPSVEASVAVPITDLAVLRWLMDDDSSPLADSISDSPNTDGALNSATLVDDSDLQGGRGVDVTGGYISGSAADISLDSDHSLFFTVKAPSPVDGCLFEWGNGNQALTLDANGIDSLGGLYYDGSSRQQTQSVSQPSAPFIVRIGYTWDADNSDMSVYVNASGTTGSDANNASARSGYRIGRQNNGKAGTDFVADDHILYNSVLTSSEIQADYDLQPWS